MHPLLERKQDEDTRLACRKEDKEQEMDLKTLSLKDLIEGQESATQLHTILQDILPLLKSGSASTAATLMTRILSSFSRPISLLEVQGMVEGLPNTRVSDERRLDASSDKRKLHQPGKSGYRRR